MSKKYLTIDEIFEGKTYKSAVGNIVKVVSINKETKFMRLYDASSECTLFIYFRPDYFVEFIR